MATPGELVDFTADALGLSRATVAQYDRVLAENGMRSKSGRGPSAAQVTARDAANLLIAILGSPIDGGSIKDAANTCFEYRVLPLRLKASDATAFRAWGLNSLRKLPALHTFGDAVEALIQENAEGGQFKIPAAGSKPLKGALTERMFGIAVESGPWAGLQASNLGEPGPRMVYAEKMRRPGDCDLHQTRNVSYTIIRILGSVVRDGLDNVARRSNI